MDTSNNSVLPSEHSTAKPLRSKAPGRRNSSTLEAVEEIKNYIRDNNLEVNDVLPTENQLVELFGFSRSTIREAIRILETLDIVEVRHGYGTRVAGMSLAPLVEGLVFRVTQSAKRSRERLTDVVDTREALDISLGARLTRNHTEESIQQMRDAVDDMRALSAQGLSFMSADLRFHRALLSQINNTVVTDLIEAMWHVHMEVVPILEMDVDITPHAEETIQAHQDIIDAIVAEDVGAYEAAVRRHYRPLRTMLATTTS